MSDIISNLKNLKEKLLKVELETREIQKQERISTDNSKILESRLKLIHQMNDSKLEINCGGKIFFISYATLSNTKFKSIFNDMKESKIFIDSSKQHFDIIIDIIRVFQKPTEHELFPLEFNQENPLKIFIQPHHDEDILRHMITEIFPESHEDLMKELRLMTLEKELSENKPNNEEQNVPNVQGGNALNNNYDNYGANYDDYNY